MWLILGLIIALGIIAIGVAVKKKKQGKPMGTDYRTYLILSRGL